MSLEDTQLPNKSSPTTSPSLKRKFDDTYGPSNPFDLSKLEATTEQLINANAERAAEHAVDQVIMEYIPTPSISKRDPSPAHSTSSTLTPTSPDATTPSYRQPSPLVGTAFAALNGNGNGAAPAPKRKKLTFAEKEEKRMVKEARDAEKAAEKARKDTERQAQAEEKARRDADREAERVRKQAEKEEKRVAMEVERERKEERKRKAAEEKQRREEEKQRVEEEKRRKERGQKTLSSFFGVPKVKREENSASPAAEGRMVEEQGTPSKVKKKLSMYEKMFPPFFTRADVTLAPINRFERDEQGAEVVQHTIDGYVTGERSSGRVRAFDAAALLHILPGDFYGRGKQVIPVKEIMAEVDGNAAKPIDLTTESQNSQIRREGNLLQSVRMKYLSFPEDVRPAYWGTYTSSPRHGLRKLARNPIRKDNMNTDYDYDSEAEWVEDEDAEDCNSDGDEEDEPDDGDDMNEFLDDEGDELVNSKRSVIQGDLIPISTGLCWEDRKKRNTNVKMMPYRMEFIIDQTLKTIDPFSTHYWQPTLALGSMDPPPSRTPLNTIKSTNANAPILQLPLSSSNSTPLQPTTSSKPPSSSKPSSTKPKSTSTTPTSTKPPPPKLIPTGDLPAFKQAVQGSNLSKVGLIEVLKKMFPDVKAVAIKGTLEAVARREGRRECEKRWVLVDG